MADELTIEYERPAIYKYQRAILDSEARFTLCEASTKVGKTASHIIWLFEQAIQGTEGQNFWWVAPVYGQAEIAFNRMRRQVSDKDFFKINESKLRLTTPTGSVIAFRSAEKPDNLYGDDVYAAVFDEFPRAREEAWHALRSTLTATKAPCKFIGNVKGKGNWGQKLALKAKAGEKGWEYHKITAYDAVAEGLLDLEEIEDAKRELPEHVFRELYLAEASDEGSNPFGGPFIRACIFPLSTHPPVCYGIDLAKSSDWTVIIGLDKFGNVCRFERFQHDWNTTTQTILSLPKATMQIDATGVGDPIVEGLQRKGAHVIGFKFTSASKQELMLGLAAAIQQKKIGFPEGPIVNELETFEYLHTRTGVRYTAPTGFHDDCVCALALAWQCFTNHASTGFVVYE